VSRPAAFWGLLMCVLAALGVTVFSGDGQFAAQMFGIGGFMLLIAVVLLATGLGERRAPGPHALPDLSPAAAAAAIGVVLVCLGAAWGLWIVWIGAGVVAVGVGGLIRELRAQRRAVREVREP
jgi:hypothetical protein